MPADTSAVSTCRMSSWTDHRTAVRRIYCRTWSSSIIARLVSSLPHTERIALTSSSAFVTNGSGTDSGPGEIDSGSSPYDSLESLVSYEVIWCHWVKRFLANEGIKDKTSKAYTSYGCLKSLPII